MFTNVYQRGVHAWKGCGQFKTVEEARHSAKQACLNGLPGTVCIGRFRPKVVA